MTRIIDHALTALTSALLTALFIILAGGGMVDARIEAAVSEHAAEPLDSNDRIIVRHEYPDGTEAMPPEVMPLWKYVWLPLEEGRADEQEFRSAFERDLHAGDATFHLTHEVIDGREW